MSQGISSSRGVWIRSRAAAAVSTTAKLPWACWRKLVLETPAPSSFPWGRDAPLRVQELQHRKVWLWGTALGWRGLFLPAGQKGC